MLHYNVNRVREYEKRFDLWSRKAAKNAGHECGVVKPAHLAKKSLFGRGRPPPHMPGHKSVSEGSLEGYLEERTSPHIRPTSREKCAPTSRGLDGRPPATSRENVPRLPKKTFPDVQRKCVPTSRENVARRPERMCPDVQRKCAPTSRENRRMYYGKRLF